VSYFTLRNDYAGGQALGDAKHAAKSAGEQSACRSQFKHRYGSHHQQTQEEGRNDEPDPFLVIREPSMHAIHGQPPFRLPSHLQSWCVNDLRLVEAPFQAIDDFCFEAARMIRRFLSQPTMKLPGQANADHPMSPLHQRKDSDNHSNCQADGESSDNGKGKGLNVHRGDTPPIIRPSRSYPMLTDHRLGLGHGLYRSAVTGQGTIYVVPSSDAHGSGRPQPCQVPHTAIHGLPRDQEKEKLGDRCFCHGACRSFIP
jgi:hypothetical protein